MTKRQEDIIRIAALGSPHGDDQVAWAVADRLSTDLLHPAIIRKITTPWDLVDLVQPDGSLIVIDACLRCGPPGTILQLSESQLEASPIARQSTHGGSMIESLKLAQALNKKLRYFVVFAIAIEACGPGADLSESARRAINDTVAKVQALLSNWLPKHYAHSNHA